MREAPAAIPALLLLTACAVAPSLRPTPSWAVVGLLAAAIAWGGRRGLAWGALAAGLWLGECRRVDEPPGGTAQTVEVEGRLCSAWRERVEFGGRSVRLCADSITGASWRTLAPPRLWLDLAASVEPTPATGERVRLRGTLSRFAGLANATPELPGPWRLRVKSEALLSRTGAPRPFARAHAAIRRRLDAALAVAGTGERPGVALARALVLGDESAMGESRRRALRRAGLAHLFAVSGFNLTLVGACAALLAGLGGRGLRAGLPAAVVLLYLAAVGPEPSMLRACVMSGLALTIFVLRRWTSAVQSLAVAGLVLVVAEPTIVDDVGFQLSFGATAGLVLAATRWRQALEALPGPLATALAVSCAAQAGALPFAVAAFGEVAPLAPLWNLLAVPWAALWLFAGMLWFGLLLVSPAAAALMAPALDPGAWPFALVERLPPSLWLSLPLAGGLVAGLALTAATALLFERRTARRLLPLVVVALPWAGAASAHGALAEVAFLDVGQGDAALVRSGAFAALVDGGGLVGRDLGAMALRPALARRGLTRLDVAILSHSDRDHCQGLLDLAALLPIGELWSSPAQLARGCGARLAAELGGRVRPLVAGMRIERSGALFEVWHPAAGGGAETSNAESLIVAITLAGRRFIFAGDVAEAQERQAIAFAAGARADVLKVAHHGASRSTGDVWLERLRPRLAVVSVGGANAYGHPSAASLARLRAAGSRVLRTDRDGEVALVRRDGGPWRLELPGSPRRVLPRG
jgi:competence protein ComEC